MQTVDKHLSSNVAWKIIDLQELRHLIDNTIDETLAQKITIIYSVAELLGKNKLKLSNKQKKYLGLLKQSAIEAAKHIRAIQKAMRLQGTHNPVPIRQHGTNNIIILDYLFTNGHKLSE